MKTVSGIAHGFSENLLLRAADVTIKERRRLILVARESPLSPIHLSNLLLLANMGVTILPPVLTYYNLPSSIADMTCHMVGKILDAFGLEAEGFHRWGERLPELSEGVRVA
jgi:polyprenyl P-hydroxybenzoate/phenylacrylic acid decarboxylase-like protein